VESFCVLSHSEEETCHLAAKLACFLLEGDVILLNGELACGKTYFVKGLAAALGSTDCVTSPTYALVNTYLTRGPDLMHIDAYRLTSVHEFRDLGLDEYLEGSIAAIEWGAKVESDFDDFLSIAFQLADRAINHRWITFAYRGSRWLNAFQQLKNQLN
jgi:tRNA threonylcarbamoyladenosine biosynthesis protein TsaE